MQLHNSTMDRAKESLDRAGVVYREALALSTQATGIALPDIDVKELRRKAEEIKRNATEIKDELDSLLDGKRNLLLDIEREIEEARTLLVRGNEQQQITSELLAEVFGNKQKAEEAVRKADKTLEEAQNTLMTLQGNEKIFDKFRL